MNLTFWKATGIRCLRTFLTTILGAQTGGKLITEVDWKATLIIALSATFWIFITCVIGGLPEVKATEVLESDMSTLGEAYSKEKDVM